MKYQCVISTWNTLFQDYDTKKMVWEEEVRAKRRELGLDDVNNKNSQKNDEIIKRNLEKTIERKMKQLETQGKN